MSTITGYLWGLGIGAILGKTTSGTNIDAIMIGIMVILMAILNNLFEYSQSLKQRKHKEVKKK